jgi:DNA-binding response OmpR family regulator
MAHVLVIDDELAVLELVRRCLEIARFTVAMVTDQRALYAAVERERPDVIIVGLLLPVRNGLALCRNLRQVSPARVLMLTTRIDEIDANLDPSDGANAYLGKPFSPRELVARVTSLLDRQDHPAGWGARQSTPAH